MSLFAGSDIRRLLAVFLAALLSWSVQAQAQAEPRDGADPAILREIGPPKNPAYVHLDELASVETMRFKRAPGLTIHTPGGKPVVLDPAKKSYLWAIDAKGKLHVAPIKKRADGTESIGHTMLVGGRAARLGGEFLYVAGKGGRPGRWVINNDSGRYSHFDASVRRKNFDAARRYIASIGIREKGRRRGTRQIDFQVDFRKPNRFEPGQSRRARYQALKGRIMTRLGGYVLKPSKGGAASEVPKKYRSSSAKLRWAKKARAKLGVPRSRSTWRKSLRRNQKARYKNARARRSLARTRLKRRARTTGATSKSNRKLRARGKKTGRARARRGK